MSPAQLHEPAGDHGSRTLPEGAWCRASSHPARSALEPEHHGAVPPHPPRPDVIEVVGGAEPARLAKLLDGDRKSTRLNSSHSQISYAVFCLKKKKKRSQCNITEKRDARTHTINCITVVC